MIDLKIAVDATRVRSGGGVAHLIGLMDIDEVNIYGVKEVHLWAYQELLDKIADKPWLIKHHPLETEQSIFHQLYWQAKKLAGEIAAAGCQILFSADATTLSRFQPMVVLSQNMLPYEKAGVAMFGWSVERLRQQFLLEIQKRAFRFANASIFLTQYAAQRIQLYSGPLNRYTCIPHGVGSEFKQANAQSQWPEKNERPIDCLYVSPIYEYKHQWVVVRAIKKLRDQGFDISLTLVGGGGHRARQMLAQQIAISDPDHAFVKVMEFLPHDQIVEMIARADLFVFASSCETFGISLLEAMAVGLPIACSSRSSLPETLRDGGEYFDPEDDDSIALAVKLLIEDPQRRHQFAVRAKELSQEYSWRKCADQTWNYLVQTYNSLPERHS
jgi:glycosyltransferase involved in cell wall biosynthesis